MASPRGAASTPPPMIGKAGRYTVFITPSNATEKSPEKLAPPVQPPPHQFEKVAPRHPPASGFGFFWDAVAKVQRLHSTVDDYLTDWLGLNQSKYQWALNDYYEGKGLHGIPVVRLEGRLLIRNDLIFDKRERLQVFRRLDKNGKKPKELMVKAQNV